MCLREIVFRNLAQQFSTICAAVCAALCVALCAALFVVPNPSEMRGKMNRMTVGKDGQKSSSKEENSAG